MSEDELKNIEKYAGVFYSPKQIAVLMEMDAAEMDIAMSDDKSEIYRAYWKGFYENEYSIRLSNIELAVAGSVPANALVLKYIQEARS